jgi:hypothetical protein
MVALPDIRPLAMPLLEPITAMVGALLAQVPPAGVLENMPDVLIHMAEGPVIAEGDGMTVT